MKKKFQNVTLPLFVFLLVTSFILFLVSGWLTYHWIKISKENDLGEKLISVGKTIIRMLSDSQRMALDKDLALAMKDSPSYKDLNAKFEQIRISNDLRNLIILSKDGTVILDPGMEYEVGEKYEKLVVELSAWEKAQVGISATAPFYEYRQNPFKSVYVPIEDKNGMVIAVLRLEANRSYFSTMFLFRTFLMWVGVVISLVLLLIALKANKMVRNLLKAEEAMATSDRFQALGTLSAGFAHEIRNPLGIIMASADLLKSEIQDESHLLLVNDIIDEVKRTNSLLTQFLLFSKTPTTTISGESVDLRSVLTAMIPLIQKGVKDNNIKIRLNIRSESDDGFFVKGDEKSVRHVLINLLLNAIESMKNKKGELGVNVTVEEEQVQIEVTDQGCGINEHDMKRIFDPFFTTKQEGTGLGLTVTKKIIESLGGSIDIKSEKDTGTTATVIFPKFVKK